MPENENILGFLDAIHPLSPALRERLQMTLKKEEYKKKTLLLKEPQTSNKVYFIEKGLVRVYYVKNGVEICSGLLCEGGVLISVKSFFDRVRTEEYMQALEDLTVYFISYDELEALYLDLPEFNVVARKLITAYYVKSEERNYMLRRHPRNTQPARIERFDIRQIPNQNEWLSCEKISHGLSNYLTCAPRRRVVKPALQGQLYRRLPQLRRLDHLHLATPPVRIDRDDHAYSLWVNKKAQSGFYEFRMRGSPYDTCLDVYFMLTPAVYRDPSFRLNIPQIRLNKIRQRH